jgi:hypothetical protein
MNPLLEGVASRLPFKSTSRAIISRRPMHEPSPMPVNAEDHGQNRLSIEQARE